MVVGPVKIELKVEIFCSKCKMNIMKTITKLTGLDKIEIDAGKSTVTVTGDVDPVDVIKQLRKIKKVAEITTVGPPKKEEEKKDDNKDPCKLPECCRACEQVYIGYQDYGGCSIM